MLVTQESQGSGNSGLLLHHTALYLASSLHDFPITNMEPRVRHPQPPAACNPGSPSNALGPKELREARPSDMPWARPQPTGLPKEVPGRSRKLLSAQLRPPAHPVITRIFGAARARFRSHRAMLTRLMEKRNKRNSHNETGTLEFFLLCVRPTPEIPLCHPQELEGAAMSCEESGGCNLTA